MRALPRFLLLPVLALPLGWAAAPAQAQSQSQSQNWEPKRVAELQALDKITARVTVLKANVGQTVQFGTLSITVRSCNAKPADEVPEYAAWMEIADTKPAQTASSGPVAPTFRGWMFAEAPALSMLEHPVYDIRLLNCR
jgi:hypothetical protein